RCSRGCTGTASCSTRGFGPRLENRCAYAWIRAAAADVAAHPFPDLGLTAGVALDNAGHRGHDLTGCAVAALKAVVLDERGLHRVQTAAIGQAFDGGNARAFGLHGQREARVHPATVDVDRAGAALPVIAALLGSGEAEPLAQGVEQGDARLERQSMLLPVDAQYDAARSIARARRRPLSLGLRAREGRKGNRCHGDG